MFLGGFFFLIRDLTLSDRGRLSIRSGADRRALVILTSRQPLLVVTAGGPIQGWAAGDGAGPGSWARERAGPGEMGLGAVGGGAHHVFLILCPSNYSLRLTGLGQPLPMGVGRGVGVAQGRPPLRGS